MEPWFDPNLFGWLPGTVLGTTFGLWGSLAGYLAPQGKGKLFILGLLYLLLGCSVTLLGAGLAAWAAGQPWTVILVMAPVGLFGLCLGIPLGLQVIWVYRMAEERSMQAKDLIGKDR